MWAVGNAILQRVASGDAQAVQQCIDQYGGLVWSLARRFCHDHAEADDAVQEIFISLWENAARFDDSVASETTFVAMIARRRLIDRRRRRMRQPETASLSDAMLKPTLPSDGQLDLSEEARQAMEMLDRLRPEQREVLELALVYGRTYEEIACATHLPLGTVKTHARRGLIRVREALSSARSKAESSAPNKAEVRS